MEFVKYAMHIIFFGLVLWLKCSIVGGIAGGSVAAVQIFAGKWHPAWVPRLFSWFVSPLCTGLTAGVVMALINIPPLSSGRFFWLIFCLAASSVAAVFVAGALASLTRNYNLKIVKTARQSMRRSSRSSGGKFAQWDNRLRALFRASPEADAMATTHRKTESHTHAAQQKIKLPPERFPSSSAPAKATHYAGHPRGDQVRQGKSEKPDK